VLLLAATAALITVYARLAGEARVRIA